MKAWQESVEAILALEPEHISMYALTLEEGTPLWQRQEELNLVSSDDQADEYLWAVNRLAEMGYEQYEVSNFAKEGYRSRHNMKYWLGQEYVGVGPSAHSDFGGRRYSYVRDLEGYISGMLNGGVIVDSSEMIPPEERGYEYLMFRMRTVEGIEGNEYSSTFRMNFTPVEKKLGGAGGQRPVALYPHGFPALQPAHRGIAGVPGGKSAGSDAGHPPGDDATIIYLACFDSVYISGVGQALLLFGRLCTGYRLVGALLTLQKGELRMIRGSPMTDAVEERNRGQAFLRKGILHAGRDLIEGLPLDDSIGDQLFQRGGQHRIGDSPHFVPQSAVA